MCVLSVLEHCVVNETYEHCAMVGGVLVWMPCWANGMGCVVRHTPVTSYRACNEWKFTGLLLLVSIL